MKDYLLRSGSMFGPSVRSAYVEYRFERCLDFRVTSTSRMFGRDPGQDLGDKFEFIRRIEAGEDAGFNLGACDDFIILTTGEVLGVIRTGMTIQEYLSYEPIMLGLSLLHLRETPPEVTEDEPLEVEFTVTVELEGGKTLNATTAVTLEK